MKAQIKGYEGLYSVDTNGVVYGRKWCTSSYNKRYGTGRKSRADGMKRVWAERRANDV